MPARRVGVIGRGRIAHGFAQAVRDGEVEGWEVAGALARPGRPPRDFPAPVFEDSRAFLAQGLDLIVEAGGPPALAEFGRDALAVADVWSISASALADEELAARLTAIGRASGHRLRLVSGSGGALDAVAAHARLAGTTIGLRAEWTGAAPAGTPAFSGAAREAVSRFKGINAMATVALAGTGLDATRMDYVGDVPGGTRRFTIAVEGPGGKFVAVSEPASDPLLGPPVVIASLVAALDRESRVIWCG